MPPCSHIRLTVVQLEKGTLNTWYDIAGDIQSLDIEETNVEYGTADDIQPVDIKGVKVEYGAEDDTQVVDIEEAKVEYGAEDTTADCVVSMASAEFDSVEENNAIRRKKYDKKRTSSVTAFIIHVHFCI